MDEQELKLLLEEGEGYKVEFKEVCKLENASFPEIEFNENYFYITFRQSKEYLKLAKKETVEKTVEKILSLIYENPKITIKELSELTGLTRRGVEWNIEKLKKSGKIKRVGSKKGGLWEAVKDE